MPPQIIYPTHSMFQRLLFSHRVSIKSLRGHVLSLCHVTQAHRVSTGILHMLLCVCDCCLCIFLMILSKLKACTYLGLHNIIAHRIAFTVFTEVTDSGTWSFLEVIVIIILTHQTAWYGTVLEGTEVFLAQQACVLFATTSM